jgi:ketosteroid isomerase-like protein
MATETDRARAAILRFYQALDELLLGKGIQGMSDAWHHDDCVTTVHPFGHWSRGWDEVFATWEEVAEVFGFYHGHDERQDGIGGIHDLRINVLGDVAYGIGVYKSRLYLPKSELILSVNCTNIVQKRDGVWKVIHHHPDQAPPDYQSSLARMVEED